MTFLGIANRAESSLLAEISDFATELQVTVGEGSKFPTSNFHVTIDDEILLCTSRTDNIFTIERGKEGTNPSRHLAGAEVELRITAQIIKELQDSITIENLWDRISATSTLVPQNANDNVNLGTGTVTAANFITGASVLTIDETEFLTNYLTTSRADIWLAGKTTGDLSEGLNLYYTDARARASISETVVGLSYDSITGVLSLTANYVIPTTTQETNWGTAYSNRVDTWTSPLAYSAQAASVGGLSTIGTSNYVVGVNNAGNAWEYKNIVGTADEIDISHTANQIQIGLPDNIIITGDLTVAGNNISDSTGNVMTFANRVVTFDNFPITPSAAPISDYQTANKKYVDDSVATENLFDRIETTIVPHNAGDDLDIPLLMRILNSTCPEKYFQDWVDNTQSSGFFKNYHIADRTPADGKVDVSSGCGFIRTTDDETAPASLFSWEAVEGLELTDNDTNYIYVDYNVGSPIAKATIDQNDITSTTSFLLGYVYRKGTELHIVNAGTSLSNIPQKNYARLREIYGFQRASGMITSEVGARYLAITAGVLYEGLNRLITSSFDSSGGDRFVYWYRDGAGGWTEVADQAQISNTHWDNDSGILEPLSKDFYAANWVYLDYEGHIHVLYPQFQAKSLADVEIRVPPTDIPPLVRDFCFLIAKVIVREDTVNIISITYPFITPFTTSGIINHNETAGLQGGTVDEYYHATFTEYSILQNTSGVNTGDQDLSGLVPYTGAADDVDLGAYSLTAKNITRYQIFTYFV